VHHEIPHANGHARAAPNARALARADIQQICSDLAVEPLGTMEETLRHCLPLVRERITVGVLDRADTVDRIWEALKVAGFVGQIGPDAVQQILADGLTHNEYLTPKTGKGEIKDVSPAGSPIVYQRASNIQPEPVQWIWERRIPRGKLTLLGGDPDQGKTLTALTIGATVTRGGKWPDGSSAEVGNVVILSAEDDAADTIVPRLQAANADMSKIYIIESVRETVADNRGEIRRIFQLERDLSALDSMLEEIGGASLVLIDVIDSYMGGTDTHRNAAVRGVLAPIKDFAARRRVAVVGLTHFSKDQSNRSPVLRFTGSIGFIGQARAGWVVTPERDEDDEPTGRKLLVRAKGNLAPDPGGLAYRIETTTVGDGIVAPRIVWDGLVNLNAAQALAPADDDKKPREEAIDWLKGYLGDCARPSADATKEASKIGIKERTLERARRQLGVVAWFRKHTNHWVIALPEVAKRMQEADRRLEERQTAMPANGNA
jgi:putative DNA primase/helicase